MRSNDFSRLQQLHKSQMPLPALSREKVTDKEKEKEEKNIIWDFVSQKERKIESGFYLKKNKNKKDIFRDLVSKKKRKDCGGGM